ncbi:hypothetical protein BGW36DRAFT_82182 [Talaromyces proteolyticus]|uniref:Zn(2)-C6 fungal-type domain-containing protein n=1 Tax=Talaromyces proteolyticus TaxID=1131652 RepID=A0AAD4KWX9_9EURO|nr:uncharacterized protein BGW36DRAFT_82182 [Talaromyces proteolyticus]KAH8703046.1 hypothetical protein BGW36DRAFT_82182 [Talaromyces proteolyticus]
MERPASRSHRASHVRDDARHPLAKACDQCHRCKVACNGERPTCNRCVMNESPCTYSTGKPIGKPKGSKNRNKLEAQRPVTNNISNAPSTQTPTNSSSSKRKTTAGASPGAYQLGNHKRQRSSISLPTPTSPDGVMLGLSREPELSSGASISSVRPIEQLEAQDGYTAAAYSAPTPEFLKLHLSSLHPPELELDLSFDRDLDSSQDWSANMANNTQHKNALDPFLPTIEQSSFTTPILPLVDGAHDSTETASIKTPAETLQAANQAGCGCISTAESLAVIPKLQQYSTRRINLSVDGALRLTRQCTSVISNHVDCPHHARTTLSQTCLLTCLMILMQVSACYAFLRVSLDDPECHNLFPVSVGGLHIEDDETRRHVVTTVLDAEIRKALALSTRLETLATNALPFEPLLSFVRQELGLALEWPRLV